MILLIDNKQAAINPGTTIDYISSNLLFSDREDFSLTITLPLRGCKQNREIFSNIYRKDVDITTLYYDAEIVAGRFRSSGAVAVVEVNDDDIKLQFLAKRSFTNYRVDMDGVFVDDLNLGSYSASLTGRTPATMWGDNDIIALPWVNNASGNLQNRAEKVNGTWQWHTVGDDDEDTEVVEGLSCQIRLYTLVSLIISRLGYSFVGGDAWQNSGWYHLYCLNTVPNAWQEHKWATMLPHWSVTEFFGELEKLMLCRFDFDHKAKTITFSFETEIMSAAGEFAIDNVVDEFSCEISSDGDDSDKYRITANTGYEECSHPLWNFYSCYWHFRTLGGTYIRQFPTLNDILAYANGHYYNSWEWLIHASGIFYAQDVRSHFVLHELFRQQVSVHIGQKTYSSGFEVCQVNSFGDYITDDDNYENVNRIKIVPAWCDDAISLTEDAYDSSSARNNAGRISRGKVLFLDCGTFDSNGDTTEVPGRDTGHCSPEELDDYYATVSQVGLFQTRKIINGEQGGKSVFDKIFVGFWYGDWARFGDKLPCPFIDTFIIENSWGETMTQLSTSVNPNAGSDYTVRCNPQAIMSGHQETLRINTPERPWGYARNAFPKVDYEKKYSFSFLADRLPNVNAKFLIRGKWYLCSQIQCQVDANGLNPVMKGTFWRITG